MTDGKHLTKAFNDLGRELEDYLKEDERALVYMCYGIASSFTSQDTGLSQDFLYSSVQVAVDLARLKIGPEFLASSLLYNPVSAGVISMPLSQLPSTPLTREVHHNLTRLLEIGKVFDQFLPWNLKHEREVKFLKARVRLADEAMEPSAQVERKRINDTLLEALFFGSSLFTAGNLKDGAAKLIVRLKEGTDPVTKYLRSQFSAATCELLSRHAAAQPPDPALLDALVRELNEQLTNSALYQSERFQHVQLLEETQNLISNKKQKPKGAELIRLNRLLLEAAYPHEIARKLFFQAVPEIPVIKAVERLHLLENTEILLPTVQLMLAQGALDGSDEFKNTDDGLSKVRFMLAQEALDVHAQALESLGVHSLKGRLEDCAFKVLSPNRYQSIVNDLDEWRETRENFVRRAVSTLKKVLSRAGIQAEVTGRPKHVYSLYLKQDRTGQPIRKINDNLGLRVLVESEEQCYQALDILHRLWKPVPGVYEEGLFRDWIAHAKPNGYQSIHTTVFHKEEQRSLEVQIRTKEMHRTAEYGVAAHWVYKKGGNKAYSHYVEILADRRRRLEDHMDARRN